MIEKSELRNWDGKSTVGVTRVYEKNHDRQEFVVEIISLINNREYQCGASWLLKTYLAERNSLDAKLVTKLYNKLPSHAAWETKLHMLQCIPFMTISILQQKAVESFLRICLRDKNKFVRAWAYGGFYILADQFPEYRVEAKQFIEAALFEESASVKARIRNVMKTGFLASHI